MLHTRKEVSCVSLLKTPSAPEEQGEKVEGTLGNEREMKHPLTIPPSPPCVYTVYTLGQEWL